MVKAICMMFIRELTTVFFSRLKFAAWIVNCSSNMDGLFYGSFFMLPLWSTDVLTFYVMCT